MLTAIDNIVLLACVAGVLLIGKYFSKTSQNMDSFYQANKSLPWSLAVGTLVASWYGGAGVIGTIGYSTTMGISAFFICFLCLDGQFHSCFLSLVIPSINIFGFEAITPPIVQFSPESVRK